MSVYLFVCVGQLDLSFVNDLFKSIAHPQIGLLVFLFICRCVLKIKSDISLLSEISIANISPQHVACIFTVLMMSFV